MSALVVLSCLIAARFTFRLLLSLSHDLIVLGFYAYEKSTKSRVYLGTEQR